MYIALSIHNFFFSFSRRVYIDTETVKGIEVKMQGSFIWPSLTPDRPIRFPLTHVGNISHRTLILENPADVPLVVQVVPLSVYPDAQSAIDVLSDRYAFHTLLFLYTYCFSLLYSHVYTVNGYRYIYWL